VAILVSAPVAASAHESGPAFDPGGAEACLQYLVALLILASSVLYIRGWTEQRRRLGRQPKAVPRFALSLFLSGQLTLCIALLPPLSTVEGLLTAHMIQHVLLIALAPALLLAGRPEVFCVSGLPRSWGRATLEERGWRVAMKMGRVLADPMPAAGLHGATMWIWHAPAAFEAAEGSVWLHALEHFSFFATAMLFWRSISHARSPVTSLSAAGSALITLVHSGFLAALIVLSPIVLYPVATAGAPRWGLSPLEDQQLAGVVMWVAPGLAYLVAGLVLVGVAITPRQAGRGAQGVRRFGTERSPTP
jgi:putative membrane protein